MNIETSPTLHAVTSSRAQDTWKTGPKKFYSDDVTVRASVLLGSQASQTHDSRNRSNINDLCTRIE